MYLKVTSHIYHSSIFLLDNPLSFFPPPCLPVSVDVTNHSNPSAHVPHIPISSLSYLYHLLHFSPLLCHQHRIISISQIRNIYSPESDSLHILHGFLYHKRTVQVKEHR